MKSIYLTPLLVEVLKNSASSMKMLNSDLVKSIEERKGSSVGDILSVAYQTNIEHIGIIQGILDEYSGQ